MSEQPQESIEAAYHRGYDAGWEAHSARSQRRERPIPTFGKEWREAKDKLVPIAEQPQSPEWKLALSMVPDRDTRRALSKAHFAALAAVLKQKNDEIANYVKGMLERQERKRK
jgi:hypothetical protein